ncbi:hypothetical protein C8Q74DRAFT_1305644 [Fomes fomentarius]|nr:hypothetical protein C8Q74DRAFT_1305644 [Fomes fomentarius]
MILSEQNTDVPLHPSSTTTVLLRGDNGFHHRSSSQQHPFSTCLLPGMPRMAAIYTPPSVQFHHHRTRQHRVL